MLKLKTGQTSGLTHWPMTRPDQNRWPGDPWPRDLVPSLHTSVFYFSVLPGSTMKQRHISHHVISMVTWMWFSVYQLQMVKCVYCVNEQLATGHPVGIVLPSTCCFWVPIILGIWQQRQLEGLTRTNLFTTKNSKNNQLVGCYLLTVSNSVCFLATVGSPPIIMCIHSKKRFFIMWQWN